MKPSVTTRVITTIIFAGLLVTPLVITHVTANREQAQAKLNENQALTRYGFHLQEVSQQAGIHFVHQAPLLDAKLEGIMPEVTSMGASVSVADFDRDGWPDLYVTNSKTGSMNALYRNMHDGTFQDVADKMGVADVNKASTGVSMGSVWGDYDNDGYEDLFLMKWGKPELFHNDQGHGFTRVSETAACPTGSTPIPRCGSTTTAMACLISLSAATTRRSWIYGI